MSLWQFSESSQPLLRRCIEAAVVDKNNKWVQKFGSSKSVDINTVIEIFGTNTDTYPNSANNEDLKTPKMAIEDMGIDKENDCVTSEENEIWREILDSGPIIHRRIDNIVSICLKSPSLFQILAIQLPIEAVENLCNYIFDTPNINQLFVEQFYAVFFPAFLKREPTRSSLDLVVKAKCCPLFFKRLLLIITRDVELSSNILLHLVYTLNVSEQTDFLISLCKVDLPDDIFIHHLSTIQTTYKNCQKSNKLDNLLIIKLKQISQSCLSNKDYGKLLFSFLQASKDYPPDILEIENIVCTHKSGFRIPCLKLLNEIKELS